MTAPSPSITIVGKDHVGTAPGRLGRYQIVKHLATGGMADVLLALTTGIEGFSRHVVVKRIHGDRARDPGFVKMFVDEARLAASLHHHNIVQVHDIGQEDGEYFFAMEYVHGEDLRKILMETAQRKQKVPLEHVISIVTAAASALHYAHNMQGPDRKPLGLVHRDVSPANILVGFDGNVKVVDFGIAKAAALRTTETAVGTLKGKVAYMAPEQCAGKAVDRRSDVFALGIVLYELTTCRRLFKGANDFLTMSAIVQGAYPRPSIHRPDLPAPLEAIILKALAVNPADRYQSADEMRAALEGFADSEVMRTSNAALAEHMRVLFGEKPEPWLTDELASPPAVVDFDGSASGIARPSVEAVESCAIPDIIAPTQSAPILRARAKAITNTPLTRDARATASALPAAAGLPSARPPLEAAPSADVAAVKAAPAATPTGRPPGPGTRPSVPRPASAPTHGATSAQLEPPSAQAPRLLVGTPAPAVPVKPALEVAASGSPPTTSPSPPVSWPTGTASEDSHVEPGDSHVEPGAAPAPAPITTPTLAAAPGSAPERPDFITEPPSDPAGIAAAPRPGNRTRVYAIGGAVAIALVAVIAFALRGDRGPSPAAAPTPARGMEDRAPIGTTAAEAPTDGEGTAPPAAAGSATVPAAATEPASVAGALAPDRADPAAATPAPPAEPVIDAPTPSETERRRPERKPPTKPLPTGFKAGPRDVKSRPGWNPDKLFPRSR